MQSVDNFAQKNERSLSEVVQGKDYDKLLPLVNYVEKNGSITTKLAAEKLGKPAPTIRRYLKDLVNLGILQKKGNTNRVVYTKAR